MGILRKILAVLAGAALPLGGLWAGGWFGEAVLWDYSVTDFPVLEIVGGALMGALGGFFLAIVAMRALHPRAVRVYLLTAGALPLVLCMGLSTALIVGQIHFSTVGLAQIQERMATNTYPVSSGGEMFWVGGFIAGCVVGVVVFAVLAVKLRPRRKAEGV